MALGKPMVATLSGGPEEIIESGRTGVLVEPGDEHALAAELRSLLDDPDRRRELGTAARAEVERRFASTSVRDPLSSLYKDVAARRNR
jgi:glycosyltransferase involved in cell wall biosynthesis